MNKSEIKRDRIAEKIVQFIAYLKNNLKLVFIIFIILIGFISMVSWNISINQDKEEMGLKEADKIMIRHGSDYTVIETKFDKRLVRRLISKEGKTKSFQNDVEIYRG